MICIRTPFRMSFFGGGSDLREFYSRYPGAVLSSTINKYMYIFVHPFFDDRIQVKYSKTELVEEIENIKHPIVREALLIAGIRGIDINSIADIPAGTGLGSSSSYTVGLLHALYHYTGETFSVEKLAQKACELEIEILGEPIGKQDQYAAAYGGFNVIRFFPDEKVELESINISPAASNKLQDNLLMFYTGLTRSASEILKDQKKNIIDKTDKLENMKQMVDLVGEARRILDTEDLRKFGKLLDINWKLKRKMSSKISDAIIDDIYSVAIKNGALGGKLLGAGGGGFLVFYCEKEQHSALRKALKKLKEIEFKFENSGSTFIHLED